MPDLLCPHCKTLVSDHGRVRPIGICKLSEAQAIRAAQRQAAAELVIGFWRERSKYEYRSLEWYYQWGLMINAMKNFKAVGILGRKGVGR